MKAYYRTAGRLLARLTELQVDGQVVAADGRGLFLLDDAAASRLGEHGIRMEKVEQAPPEPEGTQEAAPAAGAA